MSKIHSKQKQREGLIVLVYLFLSQNKTEKWSFFAKLTIIVCEL